MAPRLTKESHHAAELLPSRNVSLEVHAVDTFDFQGDVIFQHRGDAGGMLMPAPWLTAGIDWPISRFGGPCKRCDTYDIVLRLANGAFPTIRLVSLGRSLARRFRKESKPF